MNSKKINLVLNAQSDHIVGYRNGQAVLLKELGQRAYHWKTVLEKRPEARFALYVDDTLEFIAILVAALKSGKTLYLPSNALQATAESLCAYVNGYIGLFPHAFSPLSLPEAAPSADTPSLDLTVPLKKEIFVFTSGSTGEPQAIPKRVEQLTTEIQILENTFGKATQGLDVYATVSHNHIYGLLFKVFWPLYTGRPIHSESLNWPEELVKVADANSIIFVSSPAHLKRFAQSDVLKSSGKTVCAIFSSGGPLDKDTALAIKELLGTVPIEVYGSSETGGIAWRQRSKEGSESWTPLNGVKWRINPDSHTLELMSPHLYDSGWLQMADIVAPESNNRFTLKGRVDRIVKVEEKRVSLTAIERELKNTGFVADSRVILVEQPERKRQRLAAFVVLNEKGNRVLLDKGRLAMNQMLRKKLSVSLEAVTMPKIWRYLEALPVNTQGKTTQRDLFSLLEK